MTKEDWDGRAPEGVTDEDRRMGIAACEFALRNCPDISDLDLEAMARAFAYWRAKHGPRSVPPAAIQQKPVAWRWTDGGGRNSGWRYSEVDPREDPEEVRLQGAESVMTCVPLYEAPPPPAASKDAREAVATALAPSLYGGAEYKLTRQDNRRADAAITALVERGWGPHQSELLTALKDARKQLVTLGGDPGDDPYGDRIQKAVLEAAQNAISKAEKKPE